MNEQINQLTKLKELLDTGALTPEEFETARQRIFESDFQSNSKDQERSNYTPYNGLTAPHHSMTKVWIIIGTVVLVLIGLFAVISLGDNSMVSNTETILEVAADPIDYSLFEEVDVNSDEYFETHNRWKLSHFTNEWGEEKPDDPFLYTTLYSSQWNIRVDYIPPYSDNPHGLFRFSILDKDGHKENSYGPVDIIVRGTDGETKSVEITATENGFTYVQDPATVEGLKYYFDHEDFDIKIEFENYLERHSAQSHWTCYPGFFTRAINSINR